MSIRQAAIGRIEKTALGSRAARDYRFRLVMTAAFSLLLNFIYALYHGILGVMTSSIWFMAMFAYYMLLSVTRFSAVLCERKSGGRHGLEIEYFVMKLSGILLVTLGLVLGGIIYISLSQNIKTKYDKIIMISIAAYTFFKLTLAIIRAAKAKKNPAPLLSVIRNIGYAEIAASILTMQRSMLTSFEGMTEAGARAMNIITGTAVCLFVFTLGAVMTARGIKGKTSYKKSRAKRRKTTPSQAAEKGRNKSPWGKPRGEKGVHSVKGKG